MKTAEFVQAMARNATQPVVSVQNFEAMIVDIVLRALQDNREGTASKFERFVQSAVRFNGPVCSSGE